MAEFRRYERNTRYAKEEKERESERKRVDIKVRKVSKISVNWVSTGRRRKLADTYIGISAKVGYWEDAEKSEMRFSPGMGEEKYGGRDVARGAKDQ